MGCKRWAKRASTSSMSWRDRGGPGTAGPASKRDRRQGLDAQPAAGSGAILLFPPRKMRTRDAARTPMTSAAKAGLERTRAPRRRRAPEELRGAREAEPASGAWPERGVVWFAARRAGPGGLAGSPPAGRVADMAGSRLPRQLFLQGVAAVYLFAFASLYTQIPGEGAERGTPPQPAPCALSSPHLARRCLGAGVRSRP